MTATQANAPLPSVAQAYSRQYDYVVSGARENVKSLEICLKPASLNDLGLVHQWMNYPHVAEFWQQAWPEEKIAGYLEQQINSYHNVMIVSVNQVPVAYTELYPVIDDPLSKRCDHSAEDWGWHLLVGPPEFVGCGLTAAVGHAIVSYLLEHTIADEIFCEPDYANQRMIRFVSRLAHQDRGLIQLGEKCARLMVCRREDFETLSLPILTYTPVAGVEDDYIKEQL
ncbi:rhizobactin siderophore biosynthesis protein RhbD [Maricurvus nonylphenolicus]|uniref:GNAT family N-acetyltransferase n=1 Tax=Maricurvus nonylphenolicus TaxID=1008307 RepID=UPI0036F43335